jgi:hypothetical protein
LLLPPRPWRDSRKTKAATKIIAQTPLDQRYQKFRNMALFFTSAQ